MIFERDEEKIFSNYLKHWVRFEDAIDIWNDENSIEFQDSKTTLFEERFIKIGFSEIRGILTVVYCERADGEVVRIISARRPTKIERGMYERRI